jgi:hypothetical protein
MGWAHAWSDGTTEGTRMRSERAWGGPDRCGLRVDAGWVTKIIRFWQKHIPNFDFYSRFTFLVRIG